MNIASNHCVQATPGCALLLILAQVPGTPDAECWMTMRAIRNVVGIILIGLLIGCQVPKPERLSSERARAGLTAYVNDQLAGKSLGAALFWPQFSVQDWQSVKLLEGRWVVEQLPDSQGLGFTLRASIDEFGRNPKLEAAKVSFP